ncbi:hypothetical protein E2C01_001258 [Portunus trituberculatus]|uniref:Uncharacterized protein n=1 Tax=Portunus trituberculatus TaxID=210409 RepID=A0A5B7CHC9_PORTR|nr:hypothetical protein [Portunus trituberculatus]
MFLNYRVCGLCRADKLLGGHSAGLLATLALLEILPVVPDFSIFLGYATSSRAASCFAIVVGKNRKIKYSRNRFLERVEPSEPIPESIERGR